MRLRHILKTCLILCVLLTIFPLTSCHIRRGLENKIISNLEECYNTEFECESLRTDGGGAFFVCYPTDDPSLHFDGMADSRSGGISYDRFVGAIIAKEDTKLMTEYLSKSLGDIYVYGAPVHQTGSRAARVIRRGDYTIDDFMDYASCSNLFFYIFIDKTSDSFKDDPGKDYDLISGSVDSMVKYYNEKFNLDICVDMHIYYVTDKEIEFAKNFFSTHTEADYEFNQSVSPNHLITLQMGPESNGHFSQTLRLSREEYISKRERMN